MSIVQNIVVTYFKRLTFVLKLLIKTVIMFTDVNYELINFPPHDIGRR